MPNSWGGGARRTNPFYPQHLLASLHIRDHDLIFANGGQEAAGLVDCDIAGTAAVVGLDDFLGGEGRFEDRLVGRLDESDRSS